MSHAMVTLVANIFLRISFYLLAFYENNRGPGPDNYLILTLKINGTWRGERGNFGSKYFYTVFYPKEDRR